MDNQTWDLDFTYKGPLQSRISYHAGNLSTTVTCNMLGDQPLFYIDDAEDEECLFDGLMDMAGGDHEIDADFLDDLRGRLNAYEKSARLIETTHMVAIEDAFDSMFKNKASRQSFDLNTVMALGSQSATFKAYADFIEQQFIKIETDAGVRTSFYDRKQSTIKINPGLSVSNAVFSMLQAMRTAWHHKQGILINPTKFQPDDAILVNRLFAADQAIVQMEMAWELNLAGHKDIWAEFIAMSGFDLCTTYAVEAMTNFRSIKSGLAARATFEKWFISGRCKSVDRDLIQTLLGNQDGITFDTPEMSTSVTAEIVSRLGLRPQGKNYLAPIMTQIMVDGLFTEVRDRSNANFLWFISFERSFNETEQHLQDARMSTKTDSGLTAKDLNNANGTVVTFPESKSGRKASGRERDDKATVFYLDQFRSVTG